MNSREAEVFEEDQKRRSTPLCTGWAAVLAEIQCGRREIPADHPDAIRYGKRLESVEEFATRIAHLAASTQSETRECFGRMADIADKSQERAIQAIQQNVELEQDAARYRWLRSEKVSTDPLYYPFWHEFYAKLCREGKMDALIDDAMQWKEPNTDGIF